jgi:hypothetical protein
MKNSNLAIINSNGISESTLSINLKDLIEVIGERDHTDTKRKFKRYIGQFLSREIAGELNSLTFFNSRNKEVQSYIMSSEFAVGFVSYCDPAKGLAFIKQQRKVSVELETLNLEVLRCKILKLESSKPVLKVMSSQVNRRSLHNIRMDLFKKGVCDHWTETVVHHYFPVNRRGKSEGYKNIGKGKRTTVKI